jgi:hypothetical protein
MSGQIQAKAYFLKLTQILHWSILFYEYGQWICILLLFSLFFFVLKEKEICNSEKKEEKGRSTYA